MILILLLLLACVFLIGSTGKIYTPPRPPGLPIIHAGSPTTNRIINGKLCDKDGNVLKTRPQPAGKEPAHE